MALPVRVVMSILLLQKRIRWTPERKIHSSNLGFIRLGLEIENVVEFCMEGLEVS